MKKIKDVIIYCNIKKQKQKNFFSKWKKKSKVLIYKIFLFEKENLY